jgi:hypothetical protein
LNWNPPHPVIELNGQPEEAEAEAVAA